MNESLRETRTKADPDPRARVRSTPRTPGSDFQAIRSPVQEINQQCIELLARAAWEDKPGLPLARQLQARLRNAPPEALVRAAQRPFLLVDLEFMNRGWWELAKKHPARMPSSVRAGHFPKSAAIQLARAAIALLRHTLHSDGHEAVLLGAHPVVLKNLQCLTPLEIERIVERYFRDVRARWEDRPAMWDMLLQAAATGDIRLNRHFNLRAMQLLTGELL